MFTLKQVLGSSMMEEVEKIVVWICSAECFVTHLSAWIMERSDNVSDNAGNQSRHSATGV